MQATVSPRRVRAAPRLVLWLGLALLAVVGVGLLGFGLARAKPSYLPASVYADGLLNPRGLAFDSQGVLFVAEAGNGGKTRVTVSGYGYFDIGLSGRVSRVPRAGLRETLEDGLPSAFSSHRDEIGPAALATMGDDLYALSA